MLRFREMDTLGDYRQVISLPNPPIEEIAQGATAAGSSRASPTMRWRNCARSHPDRFPAFVAAVSLDDVDAALAEAERAINDAGRARHPDFHQHRRAPARRAAFCAGVRRAGRLTTCRSGCIRRAPPRMPDYAAEQKSRLRDVVVLRLALRDHASRWRGSCSAGVFDRHPGIKIITHHLGGGMIPYLRRAHRRRHGGARQPHLGRGLFEGAAHR